MLEVFRNRLRADASLVAEQVRGPSGGQADGGLSNAPYHLGDGGSDEFLYDMTAALSENEQYLTREVADALRRLDNGAFGRCEACQEPVAVERLNAMPFARHCVACAEYLRSGCDVNLNAGRPRTPHDTLAPEGSMQEDWRPNQALSGGPNVVARDGHAVGEPGGGSAIGGLAGSNGGNGDPEVSDLQDAAGSGARDLDDARDTPSSAPTSGAAAAH